jgi:2-dehydro-3-deoxyphosphogluconate aldolase / (4S)-4-hydroxy-2-oxoglutarate aldolase
MAKQQEIKNVIREQRLIPLFYHAQPQVCIDVMTALYEAGIRIIEFTNRGEAAVENFRQMVKNRNEALPGLFLAAGTIRSSDQAEDFIHAGADFLISPVFDPGICDTCYIEKTLWIPGCMTPTEIHTAERAGCRIIKLFPGNVLQPSFVSGIRELFPGLEFIPTGGVDPDAENLEAWFKAGVTAVGMGSRLISRKILAEKNYPELKQQAATLLALIKNIGLPGE